MSLTEREREILKLRQDGLSDYKIARKLGIDPPSVTWSRRNALNKLSTSKQDLEWAQNIGIKI
jgi:DNA-binding CsgD family transcriptional regulator